MAKADNKTKATEVSPQAFLAGVEPEQRRLDGLELLDRFSIWTGLEPKMWGPTIIGFGRYRYKYESGREGEFLMTGFSPRKANLSIYILPGYRFGDMQEKLAHLGKHKLGKSCLYLKSLADADIDVLGDIVREGVDYMKANYETFSA